jgi:hypothetical protein
VVDACRAEAIGGDPGVRRIEQLLDAGARRAKTAYLLASRPGEPAGEDPALRHGLMTYALLRGMAAPGLESPPAAAALDEVSDADRDRDGVVTTDELRWYADWAVPRLARALPLLVMRQGAGPARAAVDPTPRLQSADATFPLVSLPRRPSAAPGAGP